MLSFNLMNSIGVILHWDASPSHFLSMTVALRVPVGSVSALMHNNWLAGSVPSPVVGIFRERGRLSVSSLLASWIFF